MTDYMNEAERLISAHEWAIRQHDRGAEWDDAPEKTLAALLAHIQRGAPAPAEVPMPQGYVERPSDYTGDIWIESQMLAYGAACRAAGETAGYARGLREAGRNAERYSFLRGDGGPTSVRWPRWEVAHWNGNWNPVSGKELDAAIDADLRGGGEAVSMKCRLCGRGLNQIGGYLQRVNEKGVAGIWECRPTCEADLPEETAVLLAVEGEEVDELRGEVKP